MTTSPVWGDLDLSTISRSPSCMVGHSPSMLSPRARTKKVAGAFWMSGLVS
jgi:hypothetical protein